MLPFALSIPFFFLLRRIMKQPGSSPQLKQLPGGRPASAPPQRSSAPLVVVEKTPDGGTRIRATKPASKRKTPSSAKKKPFDPIEDLLSMPRPGSSPLDRGVIGPRPSATMRSSDAQEGKPLSWNKTEHPLASRAASKKKKPAPVRPPPRAKAPPPPPKAKKPKPVKLPKAKKPKPKPAPVPLRSAPPFKAPGTSLARSPEQAARDLLAYAKPAVKAKDASKRLGVKGAPNPFVAAAQRDMAGGLKPDGIYGPATRMRGQALLKTSFPAR